MEPLFRRNRLQFKRIRRASDHAHAASDTLCPVMYRFAITANITFGMCAGRAAPYARFASIAFAVIFDNTVV